MTHAADLSDVVTVLFSQTPHEQAGNELRRALIEAAYHVGTAKLLNIVADALMCHGDGHRNLLDDEHMAQVEEEARPGKRVAITRTAAHVEHIAAQVRRLGALVDEEFEAPDFSAITLGEFLELHPVRDADECEAFLRALAASPWNYHLDDNPVETLAQEPPERIAEWLHESVSRCREVLGNERMWNIYHPDVAE